MCLCFCCVLRDGRRVRGAEPLGFGSTKEAEGPASPSSYPDDAAATPPGRPAQL